MNYEDYRSMYNQALLLDEEFETVVLPVEIQDGESEDDALFRFLISKEFIERKGDKWRVKNKEEIEKYDPNLLKVIDSMIMSSIRSDIDEMVEQLRVLCAEKYPHG